MINWVEVDAGALRRNVSEFRRRLGPEPKLGAVVKSNAYGHGMLEAAKIFREAGADWLCVNNVDEGVALREAGASGPVLIMGYVPLDALGDVVAQDLEPVIYNQESVAALEQQARKQGKTARVHLKIETGTHRQGVLERNVPDFVRAIDATSSVRLAGVGTHFANIEDTTNHEFAESQIVAFNRIAEAIAQVHPQPLLRHTACSAAVLLFNRTHLDLARIGISLYGLWPSKETYVSCLERGKPSLDLTAALTWKTRIAQVKEVPEGGYVGYGLTWRATRPTTIAVLPVGYYEGFDRELSGIAHVLVRGKRAPVRGRVCMNMCMVDVTDIPGAALEDEVVLIGRQGDEKITAEQIAAWCGTISYEIVSRIHPSLPRVLV
ncbi:MAG TPA: alanine racemase [Candidatus Sulfotelmatobacter sp.]|nr:alanine racemase [Candidatus Sulfotelmatobacter sp.]